MVAHAVSALPLFPRSKMEAFLSLMHYLFSTLKFIDALHFLSLGLARSTRSKIMETHEVILQYPFPTEQIHSRYGRIQINNILMTLAMVAPKSSAESYMPQVMRVEMSCTGNLDTHKIGIDDPELLCMFVMRDESRVIDTSVFNTPMPIFALEPTGLPLETADYDEVDDHELFQDAWKVCRLI